MNSYQIAEKVLKEINNIVLKKENIEGTDITLQGEKYIVRIFSSKDGITNKTLGLPEVMEDIPIIIFQSGKFEPQ